MAKSAKPQPVRNATIEPRVYSYIRFSTPEQALGDSKRRQVDKARDFAIDINMPFDDMLTMFDPGLSAFHGTHRKKGALGTFLTAVENGRIGRGSILVVERIDRLSREGVGKTLRKIIFKLFDQGISIQTLDPKERYEPGCEESPRFIALMIYVAQARESSTLKSGDAITNWEQLQKKAGSEGSLVTAMVPHWIAVDPQRRLKLRPGAARTIKRIFKYKLAGWSPDRIVRKLNGDPAAWKPPGKPKSQSSGWRASYVLKILHSRAVLGEYQPMHRVTQKFGKEEKVVRVPRGESIADYFPAILKTPDELKMFKAIQRRFEKNRGTGGPQGRVANLFTGLVKCPYCGEPTHCLPKGRYKYLYCVNAMTKRGCKAVTISYDAVELLIIRNCLDLRPELYLPNPSEHSRQCEQLQGDLEGIEGEHAEVVQQQSNIFDQIKNTASPEMRNLYEKEYEALGKKLNQLVTVREQVQSQLSTANTSLAEFTDWQATQEVLLSRLSDPEVRLPLREDLKRFILRIEVFSRGRFSTESCYGPEFQRLHPVVNPGRPDWLTSVNEVPPLVKPKRSGKKMTAAEKKQAAQQRKEAKRLAARAKRQASLRRDALQLMTEGESLVDFIAEAADEVRLPVGHDGRAPAFLRFVRERRLSRHGSFVRVLFRTGTYIDLAPPGSIADSTVLVSNTEATQADLDDGEPAVVREWSKPKLDDLLQQWKTWRGNARKRKDYKKI